MAQDPPWGISARVLNVLWTGVFPRLVAYWWKYGGRPDSKAADWIDDAVRALEATTRTSGSPDPAIDTLKEYLKVSTGRVPITMGSDGFDFILWEEGVVLPPIARPLNAEKFLNNYNERAAMESPISIPRIGSTLRFAPVRSGTAATTGPSFRPPWKVEGRHFRGIQLVNPRLVARIWSQKAGGCGASERDAYYQRSPAGLRRLFADKLEAADFDDVMRFEVWREPRTVPAELKDVWEEDQIMVTNEGLFFPDPNLDCPPREDEILDAIIAGKAGNPIFTDTAI